MISYCLPVTLGENLLFPSWITVKNVWNLILLIETLFNLSLQVWFGVTLTGLKANRQLVQLFQVKLGLWLANNLPEIKEILISFLDIYRRKCKKIFPLMEQSTIHNFTFWVVLDQFVLMSSFFDLYSMLMRR